MSDRFFFLIEFLVFFYNFQIYGTGTQLNNMGWIRIRNSKIQSWIRIRNKLFRIRNTGKKEGSDTTNDLGRLVGGGLTWGTPPRLSRCWSSVWTPMLANHAAAYT